MVVDTVAGSRRIGAADGTADTCCFAGPHAVLMLPDGSLLVSDTPNNCIRRVHADAAGVRVSTLSTNRPLAAPKGLALADGSVLVCDSGHNKLLRLDWRDGSVAPYAGSGKRGHRDGGAAAAAFDSPAGVCVCSDGVVLVADTNNHCVRSVSSDGGGGGRLVVRTVAGSGERGHRDALASGAKFDRPAAVAASSTSEGLIYVSDSGNHCVRVVSAAAEGGIVGTIAGTAGTAGHRDGPLAQSLLASPPASRCSQSTVAVADAGRLRAAHQTSSDEVHAREAGGSAARR